MTKASPCGSRSKLTRNRHAARMVGRHCPGNAHCDDSGLTGAMAPYSTSSCSSSADDPVNSTSSDNENSHSWVSHWASACSASTVQLLLKMPARIERRALRELLEQLTFTLARRGRDDNLHDGIEIPFCAARPG